MSNVRKKKVPTAPPMPRRYSGPDSLEFWDRVKRLNGSEHAALYSLGVALQNLEEQVLRELYSAEANR